MTIEEIAMQLTLKMLDKGLFFTANAESNQDNGKAVAEMYNAIIETIKE